LFTVVSHGLFPQNPLLGLEVKQNTNSKEVIMSENNQYAARLEVDYPEKLDRLSSFFRVIWIIPIAVIISIIAGAGETVNNTIVYDQAGRIIRTGRETSGGILSALFIATLLMVLFRQRYPRWWFDFSRELTRFGYRVSAYAALLTDHYPSTVDEQSVHLEIDYPDVKNELDRFLPLFKWFFAIPHYIVLAFLVVGAVFAVILAWFAILFTGRYPRGLFDYVVGVARWGLRVNAYAFLLVTDRYPPFSLQ
jgi:mannose/fructose/N-acetylgalactosamine-specific phosphotransferase system component IIC